MVLGRAYGFLNHPGFVIFKGLYRQSELFYGKDDFSNNVVDFTYLLKKSSIYAYISLKNLRSKSKIVRVNFVKN